MTKKYAFAPGAYQLKGPREFQNDSFYAGENWLVLADGVGGHSTARMAADIAVEYYAELAQKTGPASMPEALMAAPEELASRLHAARVHDATTVVAAILDDEDRLWMSSVGDSRVLLIRGSQIIAANQLHNASAAALLLSPGNEPPYGAAAQLTRFIAYDENFPADTALARPQPDDLIILISDGVEGAAGLHNITEIIDTTTSSDDAQSVTRQILQAASAAGLTDNATCVVGRITARGN